MLKDFILRLECEGDPWVFPVDVNITAMLTYINASYRS